ncbi:hypothetical protein [Mycobacterium sp. SMC-4]|uniref:phage tail protein n=1 Tax=Mycobacterium sp. SMC-4 TaxID=2857059 RepID=UPI0021B2846D|nr:hypothetical protein [Mycobacterium sp. SMC-4]UXA17658.1 hypothetical protein KXD98_23615 [Mycobacterium sp. SMC-4]
MSDSVEVGRISVKVTPDTKDFRRKLLGDLRKIEQSIKCVIDVEPNIKGFRQKVDAATKGLKAQVDLETNAAHLRQRVQTATKGLKAEVDIGVKRGTLDRLATSLANMQGPSFGSGINPAGYAVIAAGIAAITPLLSGALGVITTALLTLPGIITAVGVPIAALTLGIDGFKAAAERLKDPFEALRGLMSERVEDQFTPVFDKLGEVFPMLRSSLPSVTQGLADMAQSLVDTITSPENLSKVEATINDIAQALKDATPGVNGFTSGFLDLIKGFTGNLPGLTDWLNTTGQSFKDWAADFTRRDWFTGKSQFDQALGGLGDTLKMLGDGLVDIGGKALDFFSDPEKIKSFKAELDGLIATLSTLVDLSNSLAGVMSKIPGFSDGEANSPMDFAPIQIQLIKEQLSKVDWSGVWAGLTHAAATAFADVAASAGVMIAGVREKAGEILSVVQQAWAGIPGIAASVWAQVVTSVSTSISQAVQSVVTGGSQILAEVGSWPGKITGALGNLGGLLVGAGKALMDGLLNGIKAGAQAVYDFVSGIAGKIAALKGPLPYDRKVLIPNGEALMQGLRTGLATGFESVLDMARSMAERISKAMQEGTDLTTMLGGKKLPDLAKMLDTIDEQNKELKVELNSTEDKSLRDTLRGNREQLQSMRDLLSLQKEKIDNESKYGEVVSDNKSMYEELGRAVFEGPINAIESVAGATGGQFLQDLGIGGQGAISQALQQGLQFGKQFVFNVASMDEALTAQNTLTAKESLQYYRR